ncbi:hypothetical protein T265_04207 [Opisthorchis viverrini]|uniref:Uncharacterized protein n=1 Tax=Opisthorchis viverrini TaxID=6198 RepID=A0A074ZP08_OPIVI|nr:hypothetical protein T265_04207 [Opisthorchis viverrini]KER29123.1 hypothetical protein T265_04207 [Opisthorchis viverrini]
MDTKEELHMFKQQLGCYSNQHKIDCYFIMEQSPQLGQISVQMYTELLWQCSLAVRVPSNKKYGTVMYEEMPDYKEETERREPST